MRGKLGYLGVLIFVCLWGSEFSPVHSLGGESVTGLPVQDSKPSSELHCLLVTGEASCPMQTSSDNRFHF